MVANLFPIPVMTWRPDAHHALLSCVHSSRRRPGKNFPNSIDNFFSILKRLDLTGMGPWTEYGLLGRRGLGRTFFWTEYPATIGHLFGMPWRTVSVISLLVYPHQVRNCIVYNLLISAPDIASLIRRVRSVYVLGGQLIRINFLLLGFLSQHTLQYRGILMKQLQTIIRWQFSRQIYWNTCVCISVLYLHHYWSIVSIILWTFRCSVIATRSQSTTPSYSSGLMFSVVTPPVVCRNNAEPPRRKVPRVRQQHPEWFRAGLPVWPSLSRATHGSLLYRGKVGSYQSDRSNRSWH